MDLKNFYKNAYENVATSFIANDSLVDFLELSLPVLSNLPPARLLLETGCGQGTHLEGRGEVWGVDFCESALNLAKNDGRYDYINFVCQDVCNLDLDLKFDLILDSHLLHCIVEKEQRDKYLKNVFNHLATGGLFYIETMVAHKELSFETELEHFYFEPVLQKGDDPIRYIELPEKIEQEILAAGFQILYLYINSGKRMIPVLEREAALRSDPVVLRIIATKNYFGE